MLSKDHKYFIRKLEFGVGKYLIGTNNYMYPLIRRRYRQQLINAALLYSYRFKELIGSLENYLKDNKVLDELNFSFGPYASIDLRFLKKAKYLKSVEISGPLDLSLPATNTLSYIYGQTHMVNILNFIRGSIHLETISICVKDTAVPFEWFMRTWEHLVDAVTKSWKVDHINIAIVIQVDYNRFSSTPQEQFIRYLNHIGKVTAKLGRMERKVFVNNVDARVFARDLMIGYKKFPLRLHRDRIYIDY
jgi:hypothetical protein